MAVGRVPRGRLGACSRGHTRCDQLGPQLTAFFTRARIFASSAAVNFFSANEVGHMPPSSRFALSLKPNVAYLELNLDAAVKKQTTLPSLAYAGIPYQVFGERAGPLALMIAWSRLAMVRSGSGISAIFASSSFSPASAFSSRARSFMAARSSAVKPLDFLVAVVLVADFRAGFFPVGFFALIVPSSAALPCSTRPARTRHDARRRLLRVGLVLSLGAVADVPDVAVRVRERAAVPAPILAGGGLEDRGAGLLRFRQDLVDPRLAADNVGEDQPAETAALRAGAHVGGQAVSAVEADQRAAVRLEEHRDAVIAEDLPAETLRVELLGPVHVLDAEEDRAHVRVHVLPPFLAWTIPHSSHPRCGLVRGASRFLIGLATRAPGLARGTAGHHRAALLRSPRQPSRSHHEDTHLDLLLHPCRYRAISSESGSRSPDGSAHLLDADVVAGGIAERAIPSPIRLVHRLLHDLGAAALQLLEGSVEVLGGQKDPAVRPLGHHLDDGAALVVGDAGVGGRRREEDGRARLIGGADRDPAHPAASHVAADLEAEGVAIEGQGCVRVVVREEGRVDGEVHGGHASSGSMTGASRFLIGLVTCFAMHGGIPAVTRAPSR